MDNLGIKQTSWWFQASKELKEFCRTISDSFLAKNDCGPLYYYDQNRGMPEFDLTSISITDDLFFQKILDFFNAILIPDNVLPCGQYDYVCLYPDLTKILGDKEYIIHNDWTNSWCVKIMNPYVLSRDVFEVIAEQLVTQINKICMFDVRIEKIGGIPCLVSSSRIYRICNAKQFNDWIDSFNNIGSDDYIHSNIRTSDFFQLAETDIERFDLTAYWQGNDDELTKLPLFVNIRQIEYERKGDLYCPYFVDRKMQVNIDDNSIIHINCNKQEICKTYFDIVMSTMRDFHFSKWINGTRYIAVCDELEHYIQYLIDNNYKQNDTRFISILHGYDNTMREALSSDEFYILQACILVGIENVDKV